jgi:Uma2 family endonuclease
MSLFESTLAEETPRFTIEQYLKLERVADERHEFLDGVIYDMAGESISHGQISMNLSALLVSQLKGKPCQAFSKDTKIFSSLQPPNQKGTKGLFSYPDLVVVCGKLDVLDHKQDVILNATVVIEVLSPSTEAFDRGEKFRKYKVNPTLKDYVLVSQRRPEIEIYRRSDENWAYETVSGIGSVASIPSIGCSLPLIDVYDRVEFPDADAYDGEIKEFLNRS